MSTIRVVRGTGSGPTRLGAYDAALADAGVHDYNLVVVSSVIPAEATVAVTGTTPDLGPAGNRLTVVQARQTVPPEGGDRGDTPDGESGQRPGVAGLGWARAADGPGILYEATGHDEAAVREEITAGLEHAAGLRDWSVADSDVVCQSVSPHEDAVAATVVLATYGESEPIL